MLAERTVLRESTPPAVKLQNGVKDDACRQTEPGLPDRCTL
jgi:hypothetical protein